MGLNNRVKYVGDYDNHECTIGRTMFYFKFSPQVASSKIARRIVNKVSKPFNKTFAGL